MRNEQKKNGRLLNEAIIKYRIEKKDIVDTMYKDNLTNYLTANNDPNNQA